MKKSPRIVFYGTPEIAVVSLQRILEAGYTVRGVVTAPDRLAGRGQKLHFSPVKEFALRNQLPLFQPQNLKDPLFLGQLQGLEPELQVVVAFRMLPEEVWSLPSSGTFNLHASLLPQYRGAAPINWVLINGEKETGVTTFFIDEAIDTGTIILRKPILVNPEETAGELHDRIKVIGAGLVIETIEILTSGKITPLPQDELEDAGFTELKPAPKISKEDCRINWDREAGTLFNFIRGLSPHPGAFTEITAADGTIFYLKILRATPETGSPEFLPGRIVCDGKTYIKVTVRDGYIHLDEVQPAGRRPMISLDFLKGYGRHFI